MQRSNSTSPHPSEGQQHPPTQGNHNQNEDQNPNQGQVNSFPSSDNHSQQHNQQYDQEGGEGQDVREGEEDIEQYSDAPPPSSQLVKYGTNLPQSTTGLIVDRIISLPPQNSFPQQQQQRNQYQGQQQGNNPRFEIPAYRPSSDQQQQRQQGPHTSTRPNSPSLPTQTIKRKPFAIPPVNPSPQINSSPIQTPNRPSDPFSRLTTDPIATNRMKQSTNSEGTTYALPPPNGAKVLVRTASKGVNGKFKVPWQASPGQEKEKEKKVDEGATQGGNKDAGEEKGVGRQGRTPTPNRAPSVEEQQVLQMLNAQRAAAQKRAQAVQEGLVKATPTSTGNKPMQDPQAQNEQIYPPKSNAKVNQSNKPPQEDQSRKRKSTGQGEKVSPQKDQSPRLSPHQGQKPPQSKVGTQSHRSQSNQQGGIERSPDQQQVTQQQQGDRRFPNDQPDQKRGDRRSSNQPAISQKGNRTSPSQQQSSEGKSQVPRVSPNIGQPPVRPGLLSHQRNQGHHRDQSQDQPQEVNNDHDSYENQPTRGRGRAPGSSPTPQHQTTMPEYMGQRRNEPKQGLTQGENDQSEDVRARDYAYQEHGSPKIKERTPVQIRGQGRVRSQGSKRSRQDQDHDQSEEQGQEDVFSIQGQVSKRRKNEVSPHSPEVQMEQQQEQGEREDVPQFDAFSEIEKYDYVKELQVPWNAMMDEMVPFIDGWAEKYLSTTMDTIYSVYGCFYNMSAQNAASLEAGVKDILEYQDTQNEIRQTLVDFRNGVAQISQRLVTKPEGSRGGTPQGGR